MLKEHASPILHLRSDEEVEALYQEWAHSLEPTPYPSIEAIANVFRLAVRRNPEIAGFNPRRYGIVTTFANWTIAAISINSTNKKGGIKNPAFLAKHQDFYWILSLTLTQPFSSLL
jgi:hypothetical protein